MNWRLEDVKEPSSWSGFLSSSPLSSQLQSTDLFVRYGVGVCINGYGVDGGLVGGYGMDRQIDELNSGSSFSFYIYYSLPLPSRFPLSPSDLTPFPLHEFKLCHLTTMEGLDAGFPGYHRYNGTGDSPPLQLVSPE